MDSMNLLLRFLYLGSDQCSYMAKSKPITIEEAVNRLQCIRSMAEGRYDLPFSVIKRVIESKFVPRNDEAIMALAYCLRHVGGENGLKLRQLIYNSVSDLLHTDNDLFLFIKYAHDIRINSDQLNPAKGFGRGMRKAVAKWYEKRTAIELANLYGKNHGMCRWTHKDLVRLSHVDFGEDQDRVNVMKAFLAKNFHVLKENEESLANGTVSPGLARLCHIIRFKSCESIPQSVNMIKEYQFGLAYMPSHLYENADVWDAILPFMNYKELLKILPTLYALNFLKPDSALSKKVYNMLGNQTIIAASKVHPIEILVLKKNYEKNKRYSEPVKDNYFHQQKRVLKRNLLPNPLIVKRMGNAINQSFQFFPKVGATFFVTLDLRLGNMNRSVFGMNNVTVMEAMVLIALSIVKREKNVFLCTFSDVPQLVQHLNVNEKDNFDKAYNYCVDNALRKTFQSLALPIECASKKKAKYDVFLTVTDSVSRFCRQGKAPVEQFKQYKSKHKQAKYIILNLSRNKNDLNLNGEKGFLEICGLNASVPKIINAFAKNQFS